jgi:hypothetical protein
MSCFESILALYVPYDFNFHEGMTSLESYGLRYVTPLVALIVVPITFRIRYTRKAYLFGSIITILYYIIVLIDVPALFTGMEYGPLFS